MIRNYCMPFILIALTQSAIAQSNSQSFKIVVSESATVGAPNESQVLVHDESDDEQTFAAQYWTVKGNMPTGVSVSFSTNQPFVHETQPTFRRDVKLELSIANTTGTANWTLDSSVDTTDYQANDLDASVRASSDNVGRATLGLTVAFITDDFGTFATGDYSTTIVGTVSAN